MNNVLQDNIPRGAGGMLRISKGGDDPMGAKIQTSKNS